MTSKCLFVFADNMISNISKVELAELTRKMREAASLHKDSLLQKRKTSAGVAQIQSDQDEHTTSGLVFERKRPETTSPIEHSHSDGRAPHQEVITIQECEAKAREEKAYGISILMSQLMTSHSFYLARIRLYCLSSQCQGKIS